MRIRRAVVLVAMLALLTAALWMAAANAQALVVPLSTKQLCDYSQTIVVATVDSTEAAWTGTPEAPHSETGTIMTSVHLRVLEVLKGTPTGDIVISGPGGRVGNTVVTFEDAPRFATGQSYVVFLDSQKRVVGWREGSLCIRDGRLPEAGVTLRNFEQSLRRITAEAPLQVRPRQLDALRRATESPSANPAASDCGGVALTQPRTMSPRRPPLVQRPLITKITPGKASAGTETKVTIIGSHFGKQRGGKSGVKFFWKQAKDAKGKWQDLWVSVDPADISLWSDTKVVCLVPIADLDYAATASSGPVVLTDGKGRASKRYAFKVSFAFGRQKWTTGSASYRINPNWLRPGFFDDNASVAAAVKAAATTWNDAGAAFTFTPEGDGVGSATRAVSNDGHNDICFCYDADIFPPGVWATLAQTSTLPPFKPRGQVRSLTEFDLVINGYAPWCNGTISKSLDLQSIVTHELGHALGLLDLYGTADVAKTMCGSFNSNQRNLSADDKSGIQWIYPKRISPGTPFAISSVAGCGSLPAVSGDTVVWVDWRHGDSDIYGRNLITGREFPICTAPRGQYHPRIAGDTVVWADTRAGYDEWDIYAYDLKAQREIPICTADGEQISPDTSGRIVVWEDSDDVYGYDLASQRTFPICVVPASQVDPSVSGDIVVWEDCRGFTGRHIYGYNLVTNREFLIGAAGDSTLGLSIAGDIVVWVDHRIDGYDRDIYGYDLSTGREFPVCTAIGDQQYPAVSGGVVVWQDERDDDHDESLDGDVYCYDLTSRRELSVSTGPGDQLHPAISGKTVVWQDSPNGWNFWTGWQADIRGTTLWP